jgi:hypothetical protein
VPLPQSIIDASNQVRTRFLGAAPAPVASGPGGGPPPPPPPGAAGPRGPLRWTGPRALDPDIFFGAVFDLFSGKKRPYRTATKEHNFDYGGWFNYFYSEIDVSRSLIYDFGRIFSVVFDLRVTARGDGLELAGDPPLAPSASFANLLTVSPGGVPKAVLQYMFELGFRRATVTSAGAYFLPDLALVSNMPQGVAHSARQGELVFAYRGDTRPPEQVIENKGAKCRADLDFWRRDAHVDAAWHPWSGAATARNEMWFRVGSRDNDYFTLNSLARNFHISCAYPMFKSFEIDQQLKGPVSGWDATKRALLSTSRVKVVSVFNTQTRQMEEVLSDDGCIYVCVLVPDREITRTWELAAYPESGVRNVRLEDLLAYIRIKRYHHPPASAAEHYDSTRSSPCMTIKTFSWKWARSEEEARATLGCTDSGMQTVTAKLNSLMGIKFDISHTAHLSSLTYNPDLKAPVAAKAAAAQRVRIGW